VNTIHRWTASVSAARSLLLVGLVAATLGACSEAEPAGPNLPAGTLVLIPNYRAEDLSADGNTVLLTDPASATADFYFYDIAAGTTTFKAAAGDALFDFATGISNAGRVSAIHGKPENAGLWEQAGGWLDLDNIYSLGCQFSENPTDLDQSGGWDIDSAGHTAVGLVWNGCSAEAFMWSDAGGAGNFIVLDNLGIPWPDTENLPNSRATVISDDGSTAGGWAQDTANVGGNFYGIDRRPTTWTSTGAGAKVPSGGVFTDDCPGEVLAIAGNGSLVAGVWCQSPWLWSAALGTIKLADFGYAQAVALNGQLVFGTQQAGFFDPPVPFVWTQAGGVVSLLDIAADNDITIPANYYWEAIVAASADGSVVVGTVYDEAFTRYTFVMKLPVSAYGL
jgi:hypothetical protein